MDDADKIKLALELYKASKSPVDHAVDFAVDVVEAPFKIVGRLFDDIFD